MAVVVDQPLPYPPQPNPYPPRPVVLLPTAGYTPWSRRVLAGLIDWAPIWLAILGPMGAVLAFGGDGCYYATYSSGDDFSRFMARRCSSEESSTWLITVAVLFLLTVPYFFCNFCYRQGKTGQSIGKSVLKFGVISENTGRPIGFWRSFARQLVHYADQAICYIGYLFPLWDSKRQTIADKALSTVCVPVTSDQRDRSAGHPPEGHGYPQSP